MYQGFRRLSTKGIWLATVMLVVTIFALPVHASNPATPASSQCVACHTDLKGLIRLCWEVEKIKPQPKTSAETAGEG